MASKLGHTTPDYTRKDVVRCAVGGAFWLSYFLLIYWITP